MKPNSGGLDIAKLLAGMGGGAGDGGFAAMGGQQGPPRSGVGGVRPGSPQPQSPSGTTPSAPIVNTAQANPTATSAIDMLMARAKGDMGLGKEIDRGVQDIRSRALAGIKGDRASRVARGVSGTGIDTFDANNQSDQQRAETNRMVNDRTIAAEGMRNDLLGSITDRSLNVSGQQLQAQGMNNQANQFQQSFGLQQQAQQNQQQNAQWQMQQDLIARQNDERYRSFQTLLNFFQ